MTMAAGRTPQGARPADPRRSGAGPPARRPSRTGSPRRASRELVVFLAIGAAGLLVQPALYWLLRAWWPTAAANLVSLLATTLLNTEANRRLAFRRSPAHPARAHLVAGVLFLGGYLVNEAATEGWRHLNPSCGRLSETLVEAAASCLFTAVRFTVLRRTVFHSPAARPPR